MHAFKTIGVNTPDREIQPFNKIKPSVNGAFGLSFNPNGKLNAKINFSSGFRSGNLAELSSNGLHEGTLRWEIGDPNLNIEQNINSESSVNYNRKNISLSLALFYNYFSNYIFLSATGTQYLGFDVFRFRQSDANLYGGEASFSIHPAKLTWFNYKAEFSTVTGKLSNGNFLPFIPPAKLHNEVTLSLNQTKKNNHFSFNVNTDNIFAQTHPAQFETGTSAYFLLNAGGSLIIYKVKRSITISIAANNVLNKNYYDHLSRFKEYRIHNTGRNIALNINYPFLIKQKTKK
ncbi:MAG: TonB-dependent receptor [Ginsengibacter sp.]